MPQIIAPNSLSAKLTDTERNKLTEFANGDPSFWRMDRDKASEWLYQMPTTQRPIVYDPEDDTNTVLLGSIENWHALLARLLKAIVLSRPS